MKIALLSHILPPSPSGQAIMLYRLFKDWSPSEYCLLSRRHYPPGETAAGGTAPLAGPYIHLPSEPALWSPPWPVVRNLRIAWNYSRGVRHRAASVYRVLRDHRCTALIACTGDLVDMPAGYLASRRAGIPFFPYVFDDFATQFLRGYPKLYARLWQRKLLTKAAGVIVPNEVLRDDYRKRYGIESTVVHNPIDTSLATDLVRLPWPAQPPRLRLLYTGAVYDAHFDAFRNLAVAIDQLNSEARSAPPRALEAAGPLDIRLEVYTGCDHAALRAIGIRGAVDFHDPVSSAAALQLQREADILFLPLAFGSPYPYLVRTSAPGKIGEYLTSGRPVLVHAPPDSFPSLYFRKYDCGMVVANNDPGALARALRRLVDEPDLRRRLVENASLRAREDFEVTKARTTLRELLSSRV